MALHLFKCIEGIEIIGSIDIAYIGSYQIKNPFIVEKELIIPFTGLRQDPNPAIPNNYKYKLTPCNHMEIDPIKYSINLEKFKILYVLNQDFLPPELIGAYLERLKTFE